MFVLVFGITGFSTNLYCQDEPDTKALVGKWSKGKRIPSGAVSLDTLESGNDARGMNSTANVQFLELNGRGPKELVIQWGCAAVGNCALEIYTKSNLRPDLLLSADMVQSIKVLKSMHNGYFDLELSTHGSAFESYHRVYRFRANQYRRFNCWTESYEKLDRNGRRHEFKKPIITRGCTQDF